MRLADEGAGFAGGVAAMPPRRLRIAVHDYPGHPFQVELSRELARRGHTVRHFFFAADPGPKGELERRADDPVGFSIEPIAIARAYSKANLVQRWVGDRLYGRAAAARLAAFAPEVIIAGNTPLDALGAIVAGARRTRTPFVFWMQDVYSLAAGLILRRRLPGLGHALGLYYAGLEGRLLRASQGVVAISEDFRPVVEGFGARGGIAVIPNWGALPSIPVRPKANPWARRLGLEGRLVFLYSGTLAFKHNPDLLWALAERFRGDADVRVVVAAAGVSVEALRARNTANPNANLVFLPLQPMADLPDMLGAADVLVALLEPDAGRFSVPSKVLSYLCAGRPILLAAPPSNLASRVLAEAGAGLCIQSGDGAALAAAAERLRADPALRRCCGEAGRAYAESHFPIARIADRFERVFHDAVAKAGRAA